MRILSVTIAIMIFAAGLALAAGPEDILEKAQKYYEAGKWKEAKTQYELVLTKYKTNPMVSAKAVGIKEQIMRCDFYKDVFQFNKVMKEEYGIKKFTVREGKRPMVDIEFEFTNEKEANFFSGTEVRSGALISKTNFMNSAVKLKDPCIIELYPTELPAVGFQMNLFSSKDNKGDAEGYVLRCIHQEISKYEKYTQILLYYYKEGSKGKLLKQINRQGVGLGEVKKIVVSKNRGNLSFQIGNISVKEKHPDLKEGYFTFIVDNMSKVKMEKVKLKGATDANWISTIKGEIENEKWIKFKREYAEKYKGVAAEGNTGGGEEGEEGKEGDDKDKRGRRGLVERTLFEHSLIIEGKQSGEIATIGLNAVNLILAGKIKEAETQIQKGMNQFPGRYEFPYYMGVAKLYSGDRDSAIEHLEKARKINDKDPRILFAEGLAYTGKKEYAKAIELYVKSTELDPDFHAGRVFECKTIMYAGDVKSAEAKMRNYAEKYTGVKVIEEGNKMMYLLKNGPQWPSTYKAEGKHYIVWSEMSQQQADTMLKHIEAVNSYYTKFFPTIKKDHKSYVYHFRSFMSFADYLLDVGEMSPHPGIGGYYSPNLKHMVIRGDREQVDMLGTLYHEGMHQYLDYFLKDVPVWFNEGLATFFETSYFTQRGLKVGVFNKDRFPTLKAALDGRISNVRVFGMKEMMLADHKTYMGNIGYQTGVNYAHVWSLMYFFVMNKQLMNTYLKPYFDCLVEGKTGEEAFETVFASKHEELERMWRDFYMKKQYTRFTK